MLRSPGSMCFAVALLTVTWIVVKGCTRPSYGHNCTQICGANLTSSSGTIQSPGYETLYENNEICSWNIIPRTENSSVLITFESFSTQDTIDYLYIFADPPTYSSLLGEYTGNDLPYQVLHKGPVGLDFEADYEGRDKGFRIGYNIVQGIAPSFVSVMKDTTTMKGGKLLLPCHVTGTPEPDVTWYKDGLEVDSVLQSNFELQGNNLLLEDVVEEDEGVFKCKAENFLNSTEQAFRLTVYVPPVIAKHPTAINLENIINESYSDLDSYISWPYSRDQVQVVFRCSVYGVPKPVVYWKKDGVFLLNPSTVMDWLVVKPSDISVVGNYTCFANNTVGSAESRAASLTIGNVLPCHLLLRYESNYFKQLIVGSTARMSFLFKCGSYKVSNVTMTRDQHSYHLVEYKRRPWGSSSLRNDRVDLILRNFTEEGTGVYGWHLHLASSNTTVLKNTVVSSYIAIMAQGPPQVVVLPSTVLVRDFGEQLDIVCSAYFTQSIPTLRWLSDDRQMGSGRTVEASRRVKSYITVNNTFDGKEMKHYTCVATNSNGLSGNATVLVVERAETRGWSRWTKTSLCSRTCGHSQGIRLRRRRCFNDVQRCPGLNIDIKLCLPPMRNCPTQAGSTHIPRTVVPQTAQNTIVGSTSVSNGQEATLIASLSNLHPTAFSNEKKNDLGNITDTECKDSSRSSAVTVSVASATLTGIASAVITAVLTYWLMRRKNRRQMNTALDALTSTSAVSASDKDSLRYAPQALFLKTPVEASRTVTTETEKVTTSNTDKGQYQAVQFVNTPSTYTPVTHSESLCVEETFYETAVVQMAPYIEVTEGTASQIPSGDYLTLCSGGKNEDVTEHTPGT